MSAEQKLAENHFKYEEHSEPVFDGLTPTPVVDTAVFVSLEDSARRTYAEAWKDANNFRYQAHQADLKRINALKSRIAARVAQVWPDTDALIVLVEHTPSELEPEKYQVLARRTFSDEMIDLTPDEHTKRIEEHFDEISEIDAMMDRNHRQYNYQPFTIHPITCSETHTVATVPMHSLDELVSSLQGASA